MTRPAQGPTPVVSTARFICSRHASSLGVVVAIEYSPGVICAACGTENRAGSKFCDNCGAGLAAACPNCGEPNRSRCALLRELRPRSRGRCGRRPGSNAGPDRRGGAAPRHRPLHRPRRLHDDRRGPRSGSRPRAPEQRISTPRRGSSRCTAGSSRSSSATRSWRSGARQSPTRTTPSARSAQGWSSSTPSRRCTPISRPEPAS